MQTHLNRIFIIIIISIVIIILFWRWNAVRCLFVKVKRKPPLVRQYYSLDTGFKNTSGDFRLPPLQEVTARRYGLFPVCVWKFILEEVQEQWKPLWITSSLGSHQVFLGEKSVQVLQAEKQWKRENKQESAREIKGLKLRRWAESSYMEEQRAESHASMGGENQLKPVQNFLQLKKLLTVHWTDFTAPPAKVKCKWVIEPDFLYFSPVYSCYFDFSLCISLVELILRHRWSHIHLTALANSGMCYNKPVLLPHFTHYQFSYSYISEKKSLHQCSGKTVRINSERYTFILVILLFFSEMHRAYRLAL